MTSPTQAHRYLQIETSLGADAIILTRASGQEQLGGMFEITVEFFRPSGDLSLDDLLGTPATLAINSERAVGKGSVGYSRYFNGCFSRIAFAGFSGEGHARFQATLVPWLWFLTRTADCRIFQEKSVPDILEAVFRAGGFSDFKKSLRGTYPPREYCVQYRESDFHFVSRLMEAEGIYYYFEHENGGHKLVLCDDMVCHTKDEKFGTLRFIGGAASADTKGGITDWNFAKEVKPGKFSHNDFNFTTPSPDTNVRLLARSSAPAPQKPLVFEVYDNPGGYGTLDDGNRYARLRMQELIADRDTARAHSDLVGIKAGSRFTLEKHPIADQNREYLITSVNWSATEGGYASGGGGGGPFFYCDFSCIPTDAVFRSVRATPRPRIEGPQTATVCGPPGEEIYVDKYGRVKVQFHWDRYGKADQNSSCWIRVTQAWAGKKWGSVYTPRVGHEVVVEFLEGDPDRPLITGRVYNAVAMPPYDLPANKTMSTLKSLSSKGGEGFNEFRFEDKKGEEQIFTHAEKDLEIRVKHDTKEWIGNDQHLIIRKDRFISIEGKSHTHIKGNQLSKVEGDDNFLIKGSHLGKVDANQHLTVSGNQNTKVGGDYNLKVGGADNQEIGADLSLKAGGNIFAKAGMNFGADAAVSVHIKGGTTVIIEATAQVSLKAGGSFVDISPAGVFISGPVVMINSGGAAGSGSGCSPKPPAAPEPPDPPTDAKEAAKADPGEKTEPSAKPLPPPAVTYSPAAMVLKAAAVDGTPFCEECARAAEEAAAEAAAKLSWIEIELVGEDDKPVPGEKYQLTLPDGTVEEGTLGGDGTARVEGFESGDCKIKFPDLDQEAWEDA